MSVTNKKSFYFLTLENKKTYIHWHKNRYGVSSKFIRIIVNENLLSVEQIMNFFCKLLSQA